MKNLDFGITGQYVLSANGTTSVMHWKIAQSPAGVTLYGNHFFKDLESLIQYYQETPCLPENMTLLEPLKVLQTEGFLEIDSRNIVKTKLLGSGNFSEVKLFNIMSNPAEVVRYT